MAKLNKKQAMEAVLDAVSASVEVQSAEPQHLRLMSHEQLRESAERVRRLTYAMLPHTNYFDDAQKECIRAILAVWRNKISAFETTDPDCIAEREASGFAFTIEHMMMEDYGDTIAFDGVTAEGARSAESSEA